jgi:hypothetical protein
LQKSGKISFFKARASKALGLTWQVWFSLRKECYVICCNSLKRSQGRNIFLSKNVKEFVFVRR